MEKSCRSGGCAEGYGWRARALQGVRAGRAWKSPLQATAALCSSSPARDPWSPSATQPLPARKTRSEPRSPAVSPSPQPQPLARSSRHQHSGFPRFPHPPTAAAPRPPRGGPELSGREETPAAERQAPGGGCGARAAVALSVSKQTGRAEESSSVPSLHPTAAGLGAYQRGAATAPAATCRDSRVARRGGSAGAGPQTRGYSRKRPATRRGPGSQPPQPCSQSPAWGGRRAGPGPGKGGAWGGAPERSGRGAQAAGEGRTRREVSGRTSRVTEQLEI